MCWAFIRTGFKQNWKVILPCSTFNRRGECWAGTLFLIASGTNFYKCSGLKITYLYYVSVWEVRREINSMELTSKHSWQGKISFLSQLHLPAFLGSWPLIQLHSQQSHSSALCLYCAMSSYCCLLPPYFKGPCDCCCPPTPIIGITFLIWDS